MAEDLGKIQVDVGLDAKSSADAAKAVAKATADANRKSAAKAAAETRQQVQRFASGRLGRVGGMAAEFAGNGRNQRFISRAAQRGYAAGGVAGGVKGAAAATARSVAKLGAAAAAALGPIGLVIAGVVVAAVSLTMFGRAIVRANRAVARQAQELSRYSGVLARERAKASIQTTRIDLARGKVLGASLSRGESLRRGITDDLSGPRALVSLIRSEVVNRLLTVVKAITSVVSMATRAILAVREVVQRAIGALTSAFAMLPAVQIAGLSDEVRALGDPMREAADETRQLRKLVKRAVEGNDAREFNRYVARDLEAISGGRLDLGRDLGLGATP